MVLRAEREPREENRVAGVGLEKIEESGACGDDGTRIEVHHIVVGHPEEPLPKQNYRVLRVADATKVRKILLI